MSLRPHPRTALVTGAADRLGRAMAIRLAAEGYGVGVHVNRSRSKGEAVVAEILAAGGQAVLVDGDLRDEAARAGLVARTAQALGPVGVLVNNASLFEEDDILGLTPDSWQAHLDVNLTAPVRLTQALAAALPADRHGVVVNMIDQRVWKPAPTFFSYTTAKAGLWHVTRTMAQALAPRLRVVAIGPGPTLQNSRQAPSDFETQRRATLLESGARPEDICNALVYLLGADAVTGQMIAVDGGQHLIWRTPDIDGVVE